MDLRTSAFGNARPADRQGTRGGIRPPRHDARRTARTQRVAALQSEDARAAAPAVRKQRGLLSLALKILRQQVLATSENRIPIHAARKVHGVRTATTDEPVETMPKRRRYGKTAAPEDYAGMAAGFGLHRKISSSLQSKNAARRHGIRFRFVLTTKVNGLESCGKIGALSVDGVTVPLR